MLLIKDFYYFLFSFELICSINNKLVIADVRPAPGAFTDKVFAFNARISIDFFIKNVPNVVAKEDVVESCTIIELEFDLF